MSRQSINLTDNLYDYLLSVSLREVPILQRLREETTSHPLGEMQIAPEQGQFLALLVELIGARNILEIGVFTGYSSLSMALALPRDGRLVACDNDDESTQIARAYWIEAGVADKVDFHLGAALDTLNRLLDGGHAQTFDMVFIDADKENYTNYYEKCLLLLRQGGLILIDNVLWSGRPADAAEQDSATSAIREFNQRLHVDDRVSLSMLPLADGVTLAVKR